MGSALLRCFEGLILIIIIVAGSVTKEVGSKGQRWIWYKSGVVNLWCEVGGK